MTCLPYPCNVCYIKAESMSCKRTIDIEFIREEWCVNYCCEECQELISDYFLVGETYFATQAYQTFL